VETAMLTQYLDELKTVNLAQGAGGRGGGGGRGGRGGPDGGGGRGGRGGEGGDSLGLGPGPGGPGGRGGGPEIKQLDLKAFLTGKTTAESAAAMVKASRLGDAEFRNSLNSKEALAKSDDPSSNWRVCWSRRRIKSGRNTRTPSARLKLRLAKESPPTGSVYSERRTIRMAPPRRASRTAW